MSPEAAAKRRRGASDRPRCPPPAEQWRLRPRHTPRAEAGAGHVGAVGGAWITWARWAGPADRPSRGSLSPRAGCVRCCGAGEAGAEGLTAGALLLWERGGTPACEQAFPALSCRVERLFLPKVTGRLDASRGGTMESEAAARVTHN